MPKIKQIDWKVFPIVAPEQKYIKLSRRERKLMERPDVKEKNYRTILLNRDKRKINAQINSLDIQTKRLKLARGELLKQLKRVDRLTKEHLLKTISLYALRLKDDCYYVGISFDIKKRFDTHLSGRGASWTRLHQPLEIIEVRSTEFYDMDDVSKLEDKMTLEYAIKYGTDKVRGGGYCQMKPHWPKDLYKTEKDG